MASHCTRETTSTVSVERPEQDLGVAVAHFDDESVSDDEKKCLCVRQRTCWIGAIALVFLSGIAIIAVAALSGGAASSTGEEDSGPPRESEAFYQERFAAFRPLVGQYSETSTLLQTGTPQSQALDWLVYEDRTVSHTSIGDTTQLRQRYAIMVLFYACGGEDWQGFEEASLDKQGETPTCDWEGSDFLQCSPATKEVTGLELSNRRLGGVLPDELTLLTALESLVLDFNFLEGPIPNSYFEKLTNLRRLLSLAFCCAPVLLVHNFLSLTHIYTFASLSFTQRSLQRSWSWNRTNSWGRFLRPSTNCRVSRLSTSVTII